MKSLPPELEGLNIFTPTVDVLPRCAQVLTTHPGPEGADIIGSGGSDGSQSHSISADAATEIMDPRWSQALESLRLMARGKRPGRLLDPGDVSDETLPERKFDGRAAAGFDQLQRHRHQLTSPGLAKSLQPGDPMKVTGLQRNEQFARGWLEKPLPQLDKRF